jgi:hypothetical protein
MEKKPIKYLILLCLIIYILTSYIFGTFNPFSIPLIVRLIQVSILIFIIYKMTE